MSAFTCGPSMAEFGPACGAAVGALVRLLVGDEFRVCEDGTVLKVVDAERDGFGPGDGTQMSGEFHLVRMGLLDCGAEFVARDVHVGLERGHAFAGPVIDEVLCIFGACELVHLGKLV